jgi:hypothetical protein
MDTTRAPREGAGRQAFLNSVFAFCAFLFGCRPAGVGRGGGATPVAAASGGRCGPGDCPYRRTSGAPQSERITKGRLRHSGQGRACLCVVCPPVATVVPRTRGKPSREHVGPGKADTAPKAPPGFAVPGQPGALRPPRGSPRPADAAPGGRPDGAGPGGCPARSSMSRPSRRRGPAGDRAPVTGRHPPAPSRRRPRDPAEGFRPARPRPRLAWSPAGSSKSSGSSGTPPAR